MTPIEQQMVDLSALCPGASATPVATGGHLIEIPNYKLPPGWSREVSNVLFLAPPGYPGAQPDCFWVDPGIQLRGGGVPQNTNETNAIPGLGPRGTWFSWHLQHWNPNLDNLARFFRAIEQRLAPAR